MIKIVCVFALIFAVCETESTEGRIYCSELPYETFTCLNAPKIIHISGRECSGSQCERLSCSFRKNGWLESKGSTDKLNKAKIGDYFDQFAKEHPGWSAAVQALKTTCLTGDLPAQGINLNCPAYDIMHCVVTAFLRNAGSQWLQTDTCQKIKPTIDACPHCPSDCYAPAIPIGSCNACLAVPTPAKAS